MKQQVETSYTSTPIRVAILIDGGLFQDMGVMSLLPKI